MTTIVQYLLKSSSCCQDANTYCFHILEQCYITPNLSYTNENEKQDIIFLGLVFTDSESTQSMAVLLLTVTFCCLCPAAAADSGLIFCS